MWQWKPDPSFYPSPRMAMSAPAEKLCYVATLNRGRGRLGPQAPDELAVVDLDPSSPSFGTVLSTVPMPVIGDELHHFGWNACSSALCPFSPHPHLERRYLLVPGLRSSRIYVIDTKENPRKPSIVKTIEAEEIKRRTGYSRPHTVHCGPDAIYVSALGSGEDGEGPGGIFMLDHFSFDVLGPWEIDRGAQKLAYDFWWHLTEDTMITSEWGRPSQFENGLVFSDLLSSQYGHHVHFWDLRRRRILQTFDLGSEYQLVFEVRPAHDPRKTYGFVGVVLNLNDLSSSIWAWHRDHGHWAIQKVIDIPAEPADSDRLPPLLKDFKAVPPFVTDIDLSLDDKFLYVACWGTGELIQYDVSDPFRPRKTGSVRAGGIDRRASHPRAKAPLVGGPQMVEISRDGRRVYFTNSLYGAVDEQLYPDLTGWMVKVDANPAGGISVDPNFFVEFGNARAHQIRLEGGDASSDTFCYPS